MKVESPVISEVQEAGVQAPEVSEAIPSLSVLVPITKGHVNLHTFYLQVVKELTPLGMPFEVVFVLDGPNFTEAERQLRELQASSAGVRVYRLNRAFGEAAALQTAAAHARGRTILTLAPQRHLFVQADGMAGLYRKCHRDGEDKPARQPHFFQDVGVVSLAHKAVERGKRPRS